MESRFAPAQGSREEVCALSEEVITPDPEVTAEDASPALTDEAVVAYLSSKVGRDVTAADIERFKNLDTMAREVMREKSDLGRAKKAAPAPDPADDDDEIDIDSIDPKTRKLLRAFVEKEFGQALSLPSVQAEDDVNEAIESFMDDHKDVTPEALGEVIAELEAIGAGPKKPTKRATTAFLKTAYDLAKSRTIDMTTIEEAAYNKALEKIAAEAKERGEVVAVEKKRGVSDKVNADKALSELGFWDRLKA